MEETEIWKLSEACAEVDAESKTESIVSHTQAVSDPQCVCGIADLEPQGRAEGTVFSGLLPKKGL